MDNLYEQARITLLIFIRTEKYL